jgi:glycerol-3-phosphate acyltransferase PlsY
VLLGFKGGKSAATGAGAALALFPSGVGLAVLAWVLVFLALRYASVASLVSGAAFLIAALALGSDWPVIAFAALGFAFVVWRHRGNIARLRAGTESRARIGRGKRDAGS